MFPIRCYSCNRCIADRYLEFVDRRRSAQLAQLCQKMEWTVLGSILDTMQIHCMHCRMILMTHVEPAAVQYLQRQL